MKMSGSWWLQVTQRLQVILIPVGIHLGVSPRCVAMLRLFLMKGLWILLVTCPGYLRTPTMEPTPRTPALPSQPLSGHVLSFSR